MKKYTVLRSYTVYEVHQVEAVDEDRAYTAVENNLTASKYGKSFDGKYHLDFTIDEGWDLSYEEGDIW